MSMVASLVIEAQANQAKAELRATAAETTKLKAATAEAGAQARETAGDFQTEAQKLALVKKAAREAAAEQKLLKAAAREAAAEQTRLRSEMGRASQSTGNLLAQFNDIGMMWAAGQSPLMTAIQQGSQVTQVIGPMGAAGAAKALGGAFLGLLNPVNLAIYAAIALGGTIVQWMFSAGEEVKSLDETVVDLGASVKDLAERGKVDVKSLKNEFGEVTPEILRLNQQINELAETTAIRDLQASIVALKAEAQGSWWGLNPFSSETLKDENQAASLLGVAPQQLDPDKSNGIAAVMVNPVVAEFQATLDQLAKAKGPVETLQVFEDLNTQFLIATGGIWAMDAAQLAYFNSIALTEAGLRRMVKEQEAAARSQAETERAVAQESFRATEAKPIDMRPAGIFGEDQAKLEEMLATMQQQAGIQQLINQYGADSAQVTAARAEAERAAFVEMVNAAKATDGLKKELIAAYDTAEALSAIPLSGIIAGWANEASRLAGNFMAAATNALAVRDANAQLAGMAVEFSPGGQAQINYGSRAPGGTTAQNALETRNTPKELSAGGGGGGGAQSEADAVADLIAKLQEEYDLLLEIDPVKKEMLRYREDLAGATDAERQEVEDLIRAEMELNAAREAGKVFSDATASFLDQVIGKGQSALEVIRQLASELLSAASNSFITGEGSFATIFGIVGDLFAPQEKAEGGMIYGEGGPTDYKVPLWGSAGEYMVNARATSRYRPLLELINAGGDVPGYASGGMIGGGAGGGGSAAGGSDRSIAIHVHVDGARGDREIERAVSAGVSAGLLQYDQKVLPHRIKKVIAQGGRVTG